MLLPFRGEKRVVFREQLGQLDILREKQSPDARGNDPITLAERANVAGPSDAGDCRVFFHVSEERLRGKRKGEQRGGTIRPVTLFLEAVGGPNQEPQVAHFVIGIPLSRAVYTRRCSTSKRRRGVCRQIFRWMLERAPDLDASTISAVHTALCASVWRACSSDCTSNSTYPLLVEDVNSSGYVSRFFVSHVVCVAVEQAHCSRQVLKQRRRTEVEEISPARRRIQA